MRIDLHRDILLPESQPEKAEKTASSRSSHLPEQAGETQFSSVPDSVTALSAKALAAPEVRLGRVEALRKQMASGTYEVSAQQIAASLLDQLRTVS